MNIVFVDSEEGMDRPKWIDNVEDFVKNILDRLEKDLWDVSIFFCTDSFIQGLNKEYRSLDMPTDILSFENNETYIAEDGIKRYSAGDIAISIESLKKNAQEYGASYDEELKRLLIHGILHLSGMDHGEAHIGKNRLFEDGSKEDQVMLELQEKLLKEYTNGVGRTIIWQE